MSTPCCVHTLHHHQPPRISGKTERSLCHYTVATRASSARILTAALSLTLCRCRIHKASLFRWHKNKKNSLCRNKTARCWAASCVWCCRLHSSCCHPHSSPYSSCPESAEREYVLWRRSSGADGGGGGSRSEGEVALPPSPLSLPPAAVLEPPALGAHAASEFKKLSGTQFTCFTGTTVQILTQLFLRDAAGSGCLGLQA